LAINPRRAAVTACGNEGPDRTRRIERLATDSEFAARPSFRDRASAPVDADIYNEGQGRSVQTSSFDGAARRWPSSLRVRVPLGGRDREWETTWPTKT
jgi:hypothetical protein